jgi:putative heme-binding domain-containing protein
MNWNQLREMDRLYLHRFSSTGKHLAFILCLLCLASSTLPNGQAEPLAEQQATNWIWVGPREGTHANILFKRQFSVSHDQTTANLKFAPCFACLRVKVDGILVGIASPYQGMKEIELGHSLSAGSHALTVEAMGVEGPSAFFIELMLANSGHASTIIRSNTNWTASSRSTSNQAQRSPETVVKLGPIENAFTRPSQQRVGIDALDNYEQWKLALQPEDGEPTNTAMFSIADNFQIQEIPFPSDSEVDLGSWVSMTVDSAGRLIIARESSGLLRLTLSATGDSIKSTEWINRDLQECRGLTFRGSDLFVNANNSKGLYRLRSDGNGFSEPELIHASSGGVGHGRNDLVVGPDQLLYSIHGDAVDLPDNAVDHTSPYREAAKGSKTREGHLLRINPDKAPDKGVGNDNVEILAAGLRNPYGIDFNQYGDCFTYDADAEHDMGAPWYRPTRMLHLTTGGDFGWRGVTGSWPAYYPDHPDNAVPGLDIGKGSPTTVKFGTRSNFPEKYREGLFILDWAYGRILLVNLLPRGSSYSMTSENFLKGRPLNVTDIEFGANGSMYLITGGRKTQSTLYRVTYAGKRNPRKTGKNKELTGHQAECKTFSARARQSRRELEALLNHEITDEQFEQAWQQLGNPDPWISHAAARVIERLPIAPWEEKAFEEKNPMIAVRAIVCLMRSQECQQTTRAIRRLVDLAQQSDRQTFRYSLDDSIQEHALYGILLATAPSHPNTGKIPPELVDTLAAMYPAANANTNEKATASTVAARFNYVLNRFLSELLATLGDEKFVSKTIDLVSQTTNPEQRLHFLYVLRNVAEGWTPNLRRSYFKHLAMAAEEQGGAGLPEFLQQIREDAMKHVPAEMRPELAAIVDTSVTSNQPATSLASPPRAKVRDWTVDQILSGNQLAGDQQRGKRVFSVAGCIHCHRFADDGHLIGPDLTAAMRRYSRRDLLAAIVRPSDVIAENYRGVQILTNDGRVFTGQITRGGDFRSPILRIATDPAHPSRVIEIQKSEITSRKNSNVSWMPDGLLDTFTRQQIFDLLSYLETAPQ